MVAEEVTGLNRPWLNVLTADKVADELLGNAIALCDAEPTVTPSDADCETPRSSALASAKVVVELLGKVKAPCAAEPRLAVSVGV